MKIKCISCRFATIDESASDRDWKAYECGNPKSEYHKSLIGVTAKSYKYALACINIPLSYIKSDRRVCRERPPCRSESGFVYLCNPYATKRVFAVES